MTRSLACAALLLSFASWAQDGGRSPRADAGAPAPAAKTDAGAADAGVAAARPRPAFALAKESATLDKWSKTRPEGRAALPTLKAVKIGERAFLGLFLENWELPASRKVDLAADVLITDCNKRIVLERANAAGTRAMDPKVHVAVPLTPPIELVYGLTDPDCAYAIKVTVFDLNRGSSWSAEGSFTVTR
jgi:hypothetical protein